MRKTSMLSEDIAMLRALPRLASFVRPGTTPYLHACRAFSASAADGKLSPELKDRIGKIVAADPVVVFMKGTQQQPMCGFSKNVKLVLDFHSVDFRDYNILEDAELREGVKLYSEWPTIPQVYVKGEFVGGCDIMIQMHKDGELSDMFDKHSIPNKFGDCKKPETKEK